MGRKMHKISTRLRTLHFIDQNKLLSAKASYRSQ